MEGICGFIVSCGSGQRSGTTASTKTCCENGVNVSYFNRTDNPEKGSPVLLYGNKKPVTVYSFRLITGFLGVFM